MAGDKQTKSERVIEGELLRGSAPGYASPVRRTLTRLVSRLSTLPFFNRMSRRAIDSATEVIEAQTKLGGALSANQLMADRLDDMPTIIAEARAARKRDLETREAERLEQAARHAKAQAAYEERFIDKRISQQAKDRTVKSNKLAEIDLDIQLYNKQNEFEDLHKPPPEQEPKKRATRGRSTKQKARDDAQKSYERETARIEAMKRRTADAKADLKKAAAKELEVELETIDKMP
jgi:flagellar biosynthesis GTPase FlhF